MFRTKGLIGLVIFAALVIAILLIFTDKWLESKIEEIGTDSNEALVEIDGLDFSIFGAHLKWNRLQVTDSDSTMLNSFETGKCAFDMEFFPLLSGKVIIKNFQISGVKTGTKRAYDGAVKKTRQQNTKGESSFISGTMDRLNSEIANLPQYRFAAAVTKFNVDSLIAILDLRSPKMIDSVRIAAQEKYSYWDKQISDNSFENDIREIESKVQTIDLNTVKSLDKIPGILKNIQQIKTQSDSLTRKFESTRNMFNNDLAFIQSSYSNIDEWIEEDYQRAMSMAKLPEFNAQSLAKIIFGPSIITKVNTYLGYVETARGYSEEFSSTQPKEEKPPRFKGQDIYFYNQYARPDFWIKNIELSGETQKQVKVSGIVKDIISDQRFINRPTNVKIEADSKDGIDMLLTAVFNYLGEKPQEILTLNYSGFSLNNTKLSDSKFLPNNIREGVGIIDANFDIQGSEIIGNIGFKADNLIFDFDEGMKAENKFEEIIQEMITDIRLITVEATIRGVGNDLKFTVNSNIDKLLSDKLNSIIGREINDSKQKLMSKINAEVAKYKEAAEKVVREKETELKTKVEKYQTIVQEKVKLVEAKKKEVEDKKKKIEEEAKGNMLNIFKKP